MEKNAGISNESPGDDDSSGGADMVGKADLTLVLAR